MTEKTEIEVPTNALRLSENNNTESKFEFKEADKNESRPRFKMVANSGSIIPNHYFWGNLGIDLEGIKLGRQKKAALRDHDPEKVVGYTDKIEVTEDGLIAEGFFTETTEEGKQALSLAREGFPWQASVYVPPSSIEKVPAGETAFVNGQELNGPGHIFRKSTLREVTFTALGADEDTDAVALSDSGKTTVKTIVYQFSSIKKTGNEDMMHDEKEVKDFENKNINQESHLEVKEASEFAVKQERTRVTAILNASCDGQEKLAQDLISSGVSLEEAQSALLSDIKERMNSRLSEMVNAAPASAGVEENQETQFSTLEEEWAFKFNNDAELKEEFVEPEIYVAYKKAVEAGSINDKGKK